MYELHIPVERGIMMKKIMLSTLMILTIIISCSCGSKEYEFTQSKSLNSDIFEYVDQETGVHYLVYKGIKKGWNYSPLQRRW